MIHPKESRTRISFPGLGGTLVALLIIMLGTAGYSIAGQVWIGFHGGLSVPNLRGGDTEFSEGYTSRRGPYFGLFAEYELRPHLSLRAEVCYASQGGKRDGRQPVIIDLPGLVLPPNLILYADFRNETILDYIEIPLLLELNWGQRPRFFINVGPYIGFLVRAKTVTEGMSSLYLDSSGTPLLIPPDFQPLPPVSFKATTNIKEDINDVGTGIAGGVGLAFPAGRGDLVLGVQFSLGLSNIQTDVESYGKNRTGALVVTVGYAYRLKEGR